MCKAPVRCVISWCNHLFIVCIAHTFFVTSCNTSILLFWWITVNSKVMKSKCTDRLLRRGHVWQSEAGTVCRLARSRRRISSAEVPFRLGNSLSSLASDKILDKFTEHTLLQVTTLYINKCKSLILLKWNIVVYAMKEIFYLENTHHYHLHWHKCNSMNGQPCHARFVTLQSKCWMLMWMTN